MRTNAEILILPFASIEGRSLAALLAAELSGGRWQAFYAAIGFAKSSGNFPDLLDALRRFAAREDTVVRLTFGADVFRPRTPGSDYAALTGLLNALDGLPNNAVHLYHDPRRTFHPKLFLFANRPANTALVIIGSSNWSEGGLVSNVEANVLLRLDLTDPEQAQALESLLDLFEQHWLEDDAE